MTNRWRDPRNPARKQAASPRQKQKRPQSRSSRPARKLKVALLGFGTVGSAVARLISQDPRSPFVLTHVFNRDVKRKKVDWLPDVHWTQSVGEVLSSDVDIVVELVGGVSPAGEWVRKALRSGKSVVTANKLLIAESGPELLKLAEESGQRIEFGASVAGGIPAIIAIQEGLMADRLVGGSGHPEWHLQLHPHQHGSAGSHASRRRWRKRKNSASPRPIPAAISMDLTPAPSSSF